VQDDPKASLNKSRMVLERIVKEVYRRELGEDPRKRSIGEILSSKPFRDKVSSRVLKWMGVVQDWGNQGSHADGVSIYADDARVALEALAQVLGWYCDEYRKCTAGQERASSTAPDAAFPGAQPTPPPLPGAAPTPLPGATPTSLPVSTPTPRPAPTTAPAAGAVPAASSASTPVGKPARRSKGCLVLLAGFFGLLLLGGLAVLVLGKFEPQGGNGSTAVKATAGAFGDVNATTRELNARAHRLYYTKPHNYPGAIASWTESLSLDPRQQELYPHLTFALYQTRQYDNCMHYGEACLQVATSSEIRAGCLRNLGICQWLAGYRTEARASLAKALQQSDSAKGHATSQALSDKLESGQGVTAWP